MSYYDLLMGANNKEDERITNLKKEYTNLVKNIQKALEWFDDKKKIDKKYYELFYRQIYKLNELEKKLEQNNIVLSNKERCYGFKTVGDKHVINV